MKVRKFTGKTANEALAMARLEMGPDALILDTRSIRRGIWGLFGGGLTEIVAATEESRGVLPFSSHLGRALGRPVQASPKGMTTQAHATAQLLQHGVDPALAFSVCEQMASGLSSEAPGELVKAAVQDIVAKAVVKPAYRRGTTIALVGPTGSGKTTTAAKIAAIAAFHHNLKVLWISADTCRVGGVEQASAYAEIMKIPLEVCPTPEQAKRAIALHPESEFVIVDTTGRSHLSHGHIETIAAIVREAGAEQVCLTVPASLGWLDAKDILDGFRPTGFNRLVITKLDETKRAGTVLNLAGLCSTPVVYFTTGQGVPDDIAPADSRIIEKMVLGGNGR